MSQICINKYFMPTFCWVDKGSLFSYSILNFKSKLLYHWSIFPRLNWIIVAKNYSSQPIFSHNPLPFTVNYCINLLQYHTVGVEQCDTVQISEVSYSVVSFSLCFLLNVYLNKKSDLYLGEGTTDLFLGDEEIIHTPSASASQWNKSYLLKYSCTIRILFNFTLHVHIRYHAHSCFYHMLHSQIAVPVILSYTFSLQILASYCLLHTLSLIEISLTLF